MKINIQDLQLTDSKCNLETTNARITSAQSNSGRVELYSLLNEKLSTQILARVVQFGKKLGQVNCHHLLNLGATSKDIKIIVNEYLKTCVEICIQSNLTKPIFPEIIIDLRELKSIENYYTKGVILFLLSLRYASQSEVCRQLQNSKNSLNLIKMLIIEHLDIPDNEMGVLSIESKKLLKIVIKNSAPIESAQFLEKRTNLSLECIHYIIMNSLGCLKANDYQKTQKALQVLTLLVENNIISSNFEYMDLILQKTLNCLNKSPLYINYDTCLQLLIELVKKGATKDIFHLLETHHINENPFWGLNLLEVLVENRTILAHSKFITKLIEENIFLLNSTNNACFAGKRLMTLLSNNILINYPQYYEIVAEKATDWFIREENSASSVDLINSLLENGLSIFSCKNCQKILEKITRLLNSDNQESNINYHSISQTVSLLKELAKSDYEFLEISNSIKEVDLLLLSRHNFFNESIEDIWTINNASDEKDLSVLIHEFFMNKALRQELIVLILLIAILIRAFLSKDHVVDLFQNR